MEATCSSVNFTFAKVRSISSGPDVILPSYSRRPASPGTLLDARRRRGCVIRCPRMPLYASRSVEVLSSSPLCVRAVL